MKNTFYLLLFWLGLSLKVPAQAIWSADFPFAGELPSNEMTELYQDEDGFVWIGTTNGLSRYDGYRLQTFQTDYLHPNRLTHNHITCIAEDSAYLWIGTRKGLNLIDKRTYRITTPGEVPLQTAHIRTICSDGKHKVWIAQNDQLLTSCFPYHEYNPIPLPRINDKPSYIHSFFYEKGKERLWICTSNGLFIYTDSTQDLRHLPPVGQTNSPFTLFQDRDGRYWLTTWGEGLWQLLTDETLKYMEYIRQDIQSPRGKVADSKFFSTAQDDTFGYIWALSYNNLYAFRYDDRAGKLMPVALPRHIDTGKMYTKILKDHDGNLWLSSYDRGTLLTFHTETIRNYPLDDLRKTLDWMPNLLTLNRDTQGRFWFIQDRFGLCLHELQHEKTVFATPEIQNLTVDARVTASSPASGGLWVAAPHRNQVYLLTYDQGTFKVNRRIRLSDASGDYVPANQMEETSDGKLWLRSGGRMLCQPADGTSLLSTPDSLHFTAFAHRDAVSVWASTSRRLYIIKVEGKRMACIPHPLAFQNHEDEEARFLCPDDSGGFWVATSMGRILYGQPEDSVFQDFSDRFDTQGMTILNLLWQNHHLWLVSHNRFIHYDTQHHSLQQYTSSDGNMSTPIFRDQAAFLSADGTLYAGGRGGFVSVTPPPSSAPKALSRAVMLTDFKSGMRSMLFNPSGRYVSGQPDRNTLTLQPEAANLSVSFSTLDYARSGKVRYAYRLEGLDTDWNYLQEGENTAYYQKLPKGNYRLVVKATDRNGQWQAPVTLLSLTQLPAWYETIWAYVAYVTTALLLIYVLLRLYLQRLRSRNRLQLQEALTQAKLDYFTNISHDLLTPLSVISCVGDYWERQYPAEEHQTTVLRHNIYRLKRLLQQVLDFRKTENGAFPPLGTPESLMALTEADIQLWQEMIFQPQNACLVMTGNFSDGMELAAIEALSELRNTTAQPPFTQSLPIGFCMRDEQSDLLEEVESDFASVQLAFDVDSEQVYPVAAEVLSTITAGNDDSMLFQALREEQALVAEIESQISRVGQFSRLVIRYDVRSEWLKDTLTKVFAYLHRLTMYVRPARLNQLRTQFTTNNAMLTDDTAALNDSLGWAWMSGDTAQADLDAAAAQYNELTAEELLDAAQTVFRPENLSIAVQYDPEAVGDLRPMLQKLREML